MADRRAMGGHHSARAACTVWLTPPAILDALGGALSFDLDPCAAPAPRPWATARRMIGPDDGDGLAIEWHDRVWLNPPYTSAELDRWMARMADHGQGVALIFARTETQAFHRHVWQRATGLLFLEGRLHFHDRNGVRAAANAGAPSVLCAYGADDLDRLAAADLAGALVPLRLARFMLVAGLEGSWSQLLRDWLAGQDRPVSVSDAYRHFARHPKARGRRHWRAKVRQQLQRVGMRVARDSYVPADERPAHG